jgi:beta-glucosidase
MYFKGEPQYHFGYGLSYTTFELSNLRTNNESVNQHGEVVISVEVKNTGDRLGDEVIQVYARFPKSKIERQAKQLKGFKRLTVDAGKTETATITIDAADLAYWNIGEHAWTVEPGPVELLVGTSSANSDLKLSATVEVTE